MGRTTKPRKAYRARPLADPVASAMAGACRLSAQDTDSQLKIARSALAGLGRGQHTAQHWRSLADVANMAESLAALGIGTGQQARDIVHTAQVTLAAIHARLQAGQRALHAREIDALQWLISLHHTQLQACSYREFEAAFHGTRNRIAQARAGNAGRGVVVVEGDLA